MSQPAAEAPVGYRRAIGEPQVRPFRVAEGDPRGDPGFRVVAIGIAPEV